MPVLVLELNDAGIQAGGEPGTGAGAPPPSRGVALIDGHSVLTGSEAADRSRLLPRRVNHRFWSELDTRPLAKPFPADLTNADLAHAHLAGIWEAAGTGATSVILAVPGTFTAEQLGLILGIARACGIPVNGLVDAAVAAAVESPAEGHLLHLDLQLHRVVFTELDRAAEVVRGAVRVSDHTGWLALEAAWAKRIADVFVRRTRFDPLHVAATEQELFRKLPVFLDEVRTGGRALLELGGGGKGHRVEIDRGEIESAVAADLEGIVHLARSQAGPGGPAAILLSHRIAALPGLDERLAEIGGAERIELPADAAVAGALRDPKAIRSPDEALPLVTRLPVPATRTVAAVPAGAPAPAPRTVSRPTHLLHEGLAHRITTEPFVLGTAVGGGGRGLDLGDAGAGIAPAHCRVFVEEDRVVVEDLGGPGSFLNGRRIAGRTTAAAGDRLRLGTPGVELLLVRMVDSDGTPRD